MRNVFLSLLLVGGVVFGTGGTAKAAPFTAGNLVVLRVGTEGGSLVNTGNEFALREYQTNGTFANNTVVIPSTGATGLQVSGTATSEGALSVSADGNLLSFTGYNPGVSGFSGSGGLPDRTAAQAPRGFGYVNSAGTYTFGGVYSGSFSNNNIRTVVSDNGTNFWAGGGNSGTLVNPASPTAVQTTVPNTRVINSFDGNLLFSTASNNVQGIWTLSGQPTTSGNVPTQLISTGAGSSPYDFELSPGPIAAGSFMYVADDRALASGGGVQRWNFDGSSWSLAYTFGGTGVTGLAVDFSTGNPTLFATNGSSLLTATDFGSGTSLSVIATAEAGTAFRGVAFAPTGGAPIPEPATVALLGLAVVGGLMLRRRVAA